MPTTNLDSTPLPLPQRLQRWGDIGGLEPEKVLWRYMSLSKLIWTIQKQRLFFTSMEELRKADPYEGMVPRSEQAHFDQHGTQFKADGKIVATGTQTAQKMADRSFVNCWHLNQTESVAMWKLYSDRNGAVLRSTVARLEESITVPEHGELYIVPVTYTPYESETATVKEPGPELAILSYKDASLAHEREVRLVFQPQGFPERPTVHIRLEKLADAILLSPTADPWLADCINELLRQNSLPPVCRQSKLQTLSL